jgi:WhiB family redox-sensing transcriptional regulator
MTVLHDPLGDAVVELLTLAARPAWHCQAACRGQPQELWYPERRGQSAAGREICAGCPVQAECGEWAIVHNEEFGTWGAMDPTERKAVRRQRPELKARPRRDNVQNQATWRFGGYASEPSRSTSRNLPPDSWRWGGGGYAGSAQRRASSAGSDHEVAGGVRSRGAPVTPAVDVEASGA